MSFTIEESKTYNAPLADVYQAAKGAIEGLEGSLLEADEANGRLVAKFHKTILGKVLGDRSRMEVVLSRQDDQTTQLDVNAYPLNAVGQKLLFGARKGVVRTVLTWFYAHLEHRLPK